MIKLLNIEPSGYSRAAKRILERVAQVTEQEMSRQQLLDSIGKYSALIVRLRTNIDAEIMDRAPRLKVIASATTGLDHIDCLEAETRGITIISLRNEFAFLRSVYATSEHTWALILSLYRHIIPAHRSVLEGAWNRDMFIGHDLEGRTIGLLGFGRIGSRVAHYAVAFGMKVLAHDPYVEDWPAGVERCESLDDMLSRIDILSIHLPLTARTLNHISDRELALLPKGAIVINTSRGGIVNEDALVDALESGWLGGAALDVISNEREPLARLRSRLIEYASSYQNLIITPHLGGATYESMEKTELFIAKKIMDYFERISA